MCSAVRLSDALVEVVPLAGPDRKEICLVAGHGLVIGSQAEGNAGTVRVAGDARRTLRTVAKSNSSTPSEGTGGNCPVGCIPLLPPQLLEGFETLSLSIRCPPAGECQSVNERNGKPEVLLDLVNPPCFLVGRFGAASGLRPGV